VEVTVAFWAAAQIEIHRTKLALHCLTLAGFDVYCPRLRERRISRGRKIEVCPALFPGYLFLQVVNGWWQARWSPGVVRLIMDGSGAPAKVPDSVIADIRMREVRGAVELPKPPGLKPGDRVRVLGGPLVGFAGLYAGQAPHERVAVLLTVLGGQRRVVLPKGDIEAVP
jgi:transcriptional antiterminator RfaH